MGRELRRVPFDFDHPIGEVWPGFVCELGGPCPENNKTCFNGNTSGGAWLESICRLIDIAAKEGMVSADERAHYARHPNQRTYPHPYLSEFPQAPRFQYHYRRPGQESNLVPLTDELADLIVGLTGLKKSEVGERFSSGHSYEIAKALLKKAKMPARWGVCTVCDGHADDPKKRAAVEAWKETPPPTGEGYQVWETVSEGSPISPVFRTAVKLEQWLIGQGYSAAAARGFIHEGSAPSAILINTPGKPSVLLKDIESCDPDAR